MALPVPTSGAADRVQVELLRAAGSTRRAALACSLSSSVIGLARQAIRQRHPSYDEQEVLLEFAALHYGPELAQHVRRYLERRGR